MTDEAQQSQYINMFREENKDAVILKHNIDSAFISHIERTNEEVKFQRIDADLTEEMKGDSANLAEETTALNDLFKKTLNKSNLEVKVENLKNQNISSMLTISEETRRMQEMMKMYGMAGADPSMVGGTENLVLNANHPLVKYLFEHADGEHASMICEQLYDLACLGNKQLAPDQMTKFINRSNEIMMLIAQ